MRVRAWWLLGAIAGCGDNLHAVPDAAEVPHDIAEQSGSRLKIEWWLEAGTRRYFRGIYDSQLGQDCTIQPVSDGYACVLGGTQAPGVAKLRVAIQHVAQSVVPTAFVGDDGFVIPDGFYDPARAVECTPTPVGASIVCAMGSPAAGDPAMALSFTSDGALERGVYTTEDGLSQHVQRLRYPQLDDECRFTADGVCAPALPTGQLASTCTTSGSCSALGPDIVVVDPAADQVLIPNEIAVLDLGSPQHVGVATVPPYGCTSPSCMLVASSGYPIANRVPLVMAVPVIDP